MSTAARMLHTLFSALGATDPFLAEVAQSEELFERADKLLADLRRTQASRRAHRRTAASAAHAVGAQATYVGDAAWLR